MKKHDDKNLKDYQSDKADKADQSQQSDQLMLPRWVKVTKGSFDEIKNVITKSKDSGLVTTIGKKIIKLSYAKELVKRIISGKFDNSEVRNMDNNIADDANALSKLNTTENRKKMLHILRSCKNIF